MGLFRALVGYGRAYVRERIFWSQPRTSTGRLAEVARHRGLNDPVGERDADRRRAADELHHMVYGSPEGD